MQRYGKFESPNPRNVAVVVKILYPECQHIAQGQTDHFIPNWKLEPLQ